MTMKITFLKKSMKTSIFVRFFSHYDMASIYYVLQEISDVTSLCSSEHAEKPLLW